MPTTSANKAENQHKDILNETYNVVSSTLLLSIIIHNRITVSLTFFEVDNILLCGWRFEPASELPENHEEMPPRYW